ncbi:hypothetical protein JKP88DRAFT_219176 [Tribonema minus]|uniref:VHS domain-containing protein n=1 Tax=Tribonema minus TaxID=303371 RepID=A0A835Z2K5_9STRA|nr:hypothetical protein JKP88DRAFT_219176 [Tribonema minus]
MRANATVEGGARRGSGAGLFPFKMPTMSELSNKVGDLLGTGEFSTYVGEMVMHATAETLVAADWSLNMGVADTIDATVEGPQNAAKALQRRLKSENAKVVSLTLTLCDVCVKNCRPPLHAALGTREFLGHVEDVAGGRLGPQVQQQALELVQQWGEAFAGSPHLYYSSLYTRMREQGAAFPPRPEGDAPLFLPPRAAPAPVPAAAGSPMPLPTVTVTPAQELVKLKLDLVCVQEKLELCQQVLQETPGIEHDDVLRELIGFLEACRPRLHELIQAGIIGHLEPDVLEGCLKINDALLRTLAAERDGTKIGVESIDLGFGDLQPGSEDELHTSAEAAAAAPFKPPANTTNFSIADEDDDDEGDAPSLAPRAPTATSTSTPAAPPAKPSAMAPPPAAAAEDPFAGLLDDAPPATAPGAKPAAAAGGGGGGGGDGAAAAAPPASARATLDDDLKDFESFLNERS